jgi:large subunit ribosomal protein L29e
MVKSKNTCHHNNSAKAFRRGIKKAKNQKKINTKGMDPKFLRNQRFAKRYNGTKRVHAEE